MVMTRLLALFGSAVLAGSLAAQQQKMMVALPPAETGSTNLPAQRIGPDDLISISVYDSPELTRAVRVGADGFIRLPLLRKPIMAIGQMPSELESKVADELRAERLLVDPVVTVTLVESRSRPISVTGAVRAPVTFQAGGSVTLLDALTRAGGLDKVAGPEILVSRPSVRGEAGLTQRVNVKDLLAGTDPALNLKLDGGEEIRVPEAGRIFVVGNVRNSGAFLVPDPEDATVFKMLALAGGVTAYHQKQAYIIRKEGAGPNKSEIPIELTKILERKAPDVQLKADDVLYIPDNTSRRRTVSALDKVLMITGAAAATALIVH